MPGETVLDTFITKYKFQSDNQALTNLERKLGGVRKKLDTVAGGMTKVGFAGAASVAGVILGALGYQRALNNLEATLDGTVEEFAAVRAEVDRVGRLLPLKNAEVANAAKEYKQMGASVEEVVRDLEALGKAKVATGLNMDFIAEKARIMADTFDTDVSSVLDKVFKLQTISPADVEGLLAGVGRSGAAAAGASLHIDQYLATLAGLRKSGLETEMVSQGLGQAIIKLQDVMSDLQGTGEPVKLAFDKIGIGMEELESIMQSGDRWFGVLLKRIKQADISQSDLATLASRLGGETYASAFQQLMGNPEMLDEFEAGIANAGESLDRFVDIQLKGAPGAVAEFGSAMDTMNIKLGEAGIMGAFEKVTNAVVFFIDKIITASPWVRQLISWTFLGMASMLGFALALKAVSFGLGAYIALVKGYLIVKKSWIAQQWALNIAMYANPIGLIILGVVALAAAAYVLITRWDEVKQKFWQFVDVIRRLKGWVVALIFLLGPLGAFIGIAILIIKHWDKVKSWFQSFVGFMSTWLPKLGAFFYDWLVQPIVDLIDLMNKIPGVDIDLGGIRDKIGRLGSVLLESPSVQSSGLQATAAATAGNRSTSLVVGDINVDARGGDTADIMANMRGEMDKELLNVVVANDSRND